MDAEINSFTSVVEALSSVWFVISMICTFLALSLAFIPAKEKSDLLQGMRKVALILLGVLTFLSLTLPVLMIYLSLFNEVPSLGVSIIVFLAGLGVSIFLTIKIYYVQVGMIEARELMKRLKEKSNQR